MMYYVVRSLGLPSLFRIQSGTRPNLDDADGKPRYELLLSTESLIEAKARKFLEETIDRQNVEATHGS